MNRRLVGLRTVAAFAGLALAVYGSSKAHAISVTTTSSGFNVSGGFKPATNDPPYDYIFDVTLSAGSILTSGDSFTIDDLVGVTPAGFPIPGESAPYPGSTTSEPFNPPDTIWGATIGTPITGPISYESNVTWEYFGATIDNSHGTSGIDLGDFVVETSINFASGAPYQAGDTISFGSSLGSGSFQIQDLSVPEPSSAILLLLGVAAIPAWKKYQVHRNRTSLISATE
jgi:hypothetical protein